MAAPNPVASTYTSSSDPPPSGSTSKSIPHPPSVSRTEYIISGLKVYVYGLVELSSSTTSVSCLWMLHPRLQTQLCMAPFAAQFITSWQSLPQSRSKGLIAVSFDQRNHGSRLVSPTANEAWRGGNERHAPDMFSCYNGTAMDTFQLLDHVEAYIFSEAADKKRITQNVVFGISLGGHAAWHVLMHDTRFSAAIITIGCPDYTRLMSDRARLSKRRAWLNTQGRDFVGSEDFPSGLVEAVRRYDPVGLLWGAGLPTRRAGQEHLHDRLADDEKATLLPLMTRTLANKRILNLSGGADKLVPYAAGKPFLDWLKKATDHAGFFGGADCTLEDIVVDGAGHEVPPAMVEHMERWLLETLTCEKVEGTGHVASRNSRM